MIRSSQTLPGRYLANEWFSYTACDSLSPRETSWLIRYTEFSGRCLADSWFVIAIRQMPKTNDCRVNPEWTIVVACHLWTYRPLFKEQFGFCLWRWGLVGLYNMMWIIYSQSKEFIRVVVLVVNLYSMTRSCRTYGFQDQPGYWYPSNSEMRANKIKQQRPKSNGQKEKETTQ